MSINDYAVLAFDTSKSRTGWALLKGFNVVEIGTIIPDKKYSKITYTDELWPIFLKWYVKRVYQITKRCNKLAPLSFGVLEDLNIQHRITAKILQEVQAAAKIGFAFFDDSLPLNPIHNSTAKASMGLAALRKKHFTPKQLELAKEHKQKPIKIAVIQSVKRIYKIDLKYHQDDEADAILLAHAMMKDIQKHLEKEN